MSTKYKLVYTAIPKTGTNSVWYILEKHFKFQVLRISKTSGSGYHDAAIVEDWHSFATVRNPYTRMASLWQQAAPTTPFPIFVSKIINREMSPFYCKTQHAWLCQGTPVILKLESLQEEFNALKWVQRHSEYPFKIERRNSKDYPDPYIQYPELKLLIAEWAHQDFVRFGYSP